MNGKLCFVLDRQGRGPGEYLEVKSFTVDADNLYVLDNIGKKLLAYDPLTGEYKASREMPIVAWDVRRCQMATLFSRLSPRAENCQKSNRHIACL